MRLNRSAVMRDRTRQRPSPDTLAKHLGAAERTNAVVLVHEREENRHRLISDDGTYTISPWLPINQMISYDIVGRYYAAIIYEGLPECFEILPAKETTLEQDHTIAG
jgi:pyridoxine 5'-phosphate synthase PdxJ